MNLNIGQLKSKWAKENNSYLKQEVGSGVQKFVKDFLKSEDLFGLKEGLSSDLLEKRKNEFTEESKTKAARKADIIIYVNPEIIIPVEVEKYKNIDAGLNQLLQYQLDLDKKYGILTDGFTWQFYNNVYLLKEFNLDQILSDSGLFKDFWQEYIKPESYYLSFFEEKGQLKISAENLLVDRAREDFFKDITTLIRSFKNKLKIEGYFKDLEKKEKEKKAVEITYAYIIQFILYKTLVDNEFGEFNKEFTERVDEIHKCLKSRQYGKVLGIIDGISNEISKNIYRPFAKEQEFINNTLIELYRKPKNELHEVSPWLDIFVFIKKYNFANVRNEIFGYIYENYLKELYEDTKKGQYFTDPDVVNFMLKQVGYDAENIRKRLSNEPAEDYISIIDPSCGSGTFLYSALDQLIRAVPNGSEESSKKIEELINNNIFGLDIAEFPLYLAEMNILMRMLPLIINEKYNNPIDKKIKVFLTKDSIAEFIDTGLKNTLNDISVAGGQRSLFDSKKLDFDYKSFMREKGDLAEMKESMRPPRRRFDYVIGNPPYISFKECSKQKVLFFELMKSKKIRMSDIYGVNLHSIPSSPKKYAPNPNLYAFFIALGVALLKDNGKLCYIIPQTILTAGDLDVLRYHLAKFTTIEKIITFSGKMFIGRGLKQDKPVATSSLVFVVRKKTPSLTNQVETIYYKDPNDDIEKCLKNILENKKVSKKKILQGKLLQNVANWNFIKRGKAFLDFYEEYKKNTDSIGIYYNHALAENKFKNKFYFDRGLKYPKNKIQDQSLNEEGYYIVEIKKGRFTPDIGNNFIASKLLDFPFGSQGEVVFKQKYKIIWSYINYDHFRFSDDKIMIDYNSVLISSENRNELIYILSILNSLTIVNVLNGLLRNENEKDILIGIKTIKEFVRVPKITEDNQSIKDEIIKKTEEMLALEEIKLSDLVDFSQVMMQKFDGIEIEDNNLVLVKDERKIKCKIKNDYDLVKKITKERFNNKLFKDKEINLSELKSFSAIDFEKQKALKDYIDDLVFALYFNVRLKEIDFSKAKSLKKECEKSEFYKIITK